MDTNIIAFDSHKRYTQICIETQEGNRIYENRLNHERGAIRKFLEPLPDGSPVAIETIGNWYWIVDEIESAQMEPRLVDARKAKMMLCFSNKTDKLDARGLNKLQRAGTLPIVWIPPGDFCGINANYPAMTAKRRLWRISPFLPCPRPGEGNALRTC